MATQAYLRIKGHPIPGGRTDLAHRGWVPVEAVIMQSPSTGESEGPTGMLTGKRQHKPVKVNRRVDQTTPLLLKALCKSETNNEIWFEFLGSVGGGSSRRAMVRCRAKNAVLARRKVKRPPKGAGRYHLGTEEYTLRCTGLVFDSKRSSKS